MVRSLRFDNQIPPSVVAEPERASWGLTEVAAVRLEDPPEPGAPLHHVAISWEGATRIDVVFGSLIVSEH